MDDHLIAIGGDEHDDLEEVGGAVRTDDQPTVRVLTEVVDDHGVFDGVDDVVVGDAMAASGRVDLHTAILYYETLPRQAPATKATAT